MFSSIRSLIAATVCVLVLGMVVAAPSPVFAMPTAETVDIPVPVVGEDSVGSPRRTDVLETRVPHLPRDASLNSGWAGLSMDLTLWVFGAAQ